MQTVSQDRSEWNVAFIPTALDDYGLDIYEFRIYCHLARRANGGKAWPAVMNISKLCKIGHHRVREAIDSLLDKRMITRLERPGTSTIYTLTRPSTWKEPLPDQEGVSVSTPAGLGIPPLPDQEGVPLPDQADEGILSEGTPTKVLQCTGRLPAGGALEDEDECARKIRNFKPQRELKLPAHKNRKKILSGQEIAAADAILTRLSERTGVAFSGAHAYHMAITRCLKSVGGDLDGILKMVDRYCSCWSGTEMREHLTPLTLFNGKFQERYDMRDQPIRNGHENQTVCPTIGAKTGELTKTIIARQRAETERWIQRRMAAKMA